MPISWSVSVGSASSDSAGVRLFGTHARVIALPIMPMRKPMRKPPRFRPMSE